METPTGLYDVIRGPRPPSHRWPLATPAQWRLRQPQVYSWDSPQRRWNSGPRVSVRTSCSFQQKEKLIQVGPVESAAIGGSFSCFRRVKFSREGSDREPFWLKPFLAQTIHCSSIRLRGLSCVWFAVSACCVGPIALLQKVETLDFFSCGVVFGCGHCRYQL